MSETCDNVNISNKWARCRTFQLCLHAFRALEEPHEGPELLLSALMTSLCGMKKHDIAASLQADMLGVTGYKQSVAVLSSQLSRDSHWTCHCAGKGYYRITYLSGFFERNQQVARFDWKIFHCAHESCVHCQ